MSGASSFRMTQSQHKLNADEEKNMWKDFKAHFKNPKRPNLTACHQDFLFTKGE